ncbi:hypothetical protein [Vibrio europaeus]|nr:hypothetical protein [Vibrio europaeus]MDC5725607.1 hypothetical protein [Vibrio europaeus]MDC5728209.1 hypothetical protein [Vibrio europaeus]MDC5734421.1 hypothetical protein [Vibrio europaeus]MDC5739702.1 hypothetical protein [Vibrio europaeus]
MTEKAMAEPVAMHLEGADVAVVVEYFLGRLVNEIPEENLEVVLKSCSSEIDIHSRK